VVRPEPADVDDEVAPVAVEVVPLAAEQLVVPTHGSKEQRGCRKEPPGVCVTIAIRSAVVDEGRAASRLPGPPSTVTSNASGLMVRLVCIASLPLG
jgi:hypothetical protein